MVNIMSPIVTKVNSNGSHVYQSKQYESLARISPLNYRTQRELDEKYRFNLVTGLKTLLVFQPIGLVNYTSVTEVSTMNITLQCEIRQK